jgi:hypothetical protein
MMTERGIFEINLNQTEVLCEYGWTGGARFMKINFEVGGHIKKSKNPKVHPKVS